MNLKQNGNGHPKPYLRIVLLVVVVILVVVLLFRLGARLAGPKRTAWVATEELAQGSVVGPQNFEKKRLRETNVPADAVEDLSAVTGRRLAKAKSAGTPLVAADFGGAGKDAGSIAQLVPEGRVLMTLEVGAHELPLADLRRGDRLNLLAVNNRGESDSVASDAYFVGWIRPSKQNGGREKSSLFGVDLSPPMRSPASDTVPILLALLPNDVGRVARAEAARLRINVVLHGRTEVQEGQLLELPASRRTQVELISGGKRQNVALRP